jgi:hypothetical protein
MKLRSLTLLAAILLPLPLACDHAQELAGSAAAVGALGAKAEPSAAQAYPAPGTCTTDNTDPNYTCKTCTSSGGGVITITCTPKAKMAFF